VRYLSSTLCIALAAVVSCVRAAGQTGSATAPENDLREYQGTYRWSSDSTLYLQLWSEFSGKNQLVAFDESGDVRTLYPVSRDRFTLGPGAAVPSPVEGNVTFRRDASGRIVSLEWERIGGAKRAAERVEIERRENVSFASDSIRLAGMLISPTTKKKHPAIILVHASGAEDREYMVPLAHFLVRHGMALLSYDKRGAGESTGNWRTASFSDLADDVLAALRYLETRDDVDRTQIGLFGWSQAGWIMPLATTRARDLAFLISVSGAAIPPSETAVDEARNEMAARGMKPDTREQIIKLMELQYAYARTGQGWDDYMSARAALSARFGAPPAAYPSSPNDSTWTFIRKVYGYDPAPTLRQLKVPTLALFGELDDNILADKNRSAWDRYLREAGNPDYSLRVLPRANHLQLEATTGINAEMPSLKRFVPAYFTTIRDWLATRVRGFDGADSAPPPKLRLQK
jgi:uncharacterized protein